jgi:hypothetical protein
MNCLPCSLAEAKDVPAAFGWFAWKIVVLVMSVLTIACGGSPFTVDYASLASGDDAQTASPADAGQDSAHADPDSAWWGVVDAMEGGSDAADGGIPSDAGEASSPDAIGPADAHADGGSPSDSASWVIDGGGKGLCCRTEVYPGCTLAWIPVDSGKVNDPCVDTTSCVQAGSVVPCP